MTSSGARESTAGQDPLAAIRSLSTLASKDGAALLVLQNFHRFLQSAEIVQALIRQIQAGKQQRTFVVILSPVVSIPVELDKLLIVIEHERPGREQLWEIAQGIATQPGELPTGTEREQLRIEVCWELKPSTSVRQNRSLDSLHGNRRVLIGLAPED